ncbi:hypothetical protein R5R35_009686 [Gryllus longicercus]|uniref:Mitochondrial 2-oxodicarboxylate carrier n=1 Tax=Gryllus longicercus TaxID=2509291 RepID=A0AAN9VK57_9ORTH
MHESTSLLKQASMQVAAGGSAGFIEVCIMHPLDLVKTRLQIQSTHAKKGSMPGISAVKLSEAQYRGVFDCLSKMYRNEGFFSFWKGVLPPILVETPKRAVKFLTFEQTKRFFLFGSPTPTAVTFSMAGMCAGVFEAVLVNPFEVVKVTLQSNRAHMHQTPSTWTVTKEIIRTEGFGFRGINKGLTATIARNGVFNSFYFGFYHSVKGMLPEYEEPLPEFLRKVGIGFTSGTLASMMNIPFDVAKSRIQGPQPVSGQRKYYSTLQSMRLVYIEEGWRALYKGLVPKVMRLGPGGAIMLVVYDYMYQYLVKKFPN